MTEHFIGTHEVPFYKCGHREAEHVLTAIRRYCTKCPCETNECLCNTPSGLDDDCLMHGINRLTAMDEDNSGAWEETRTGVYAEDLRKIPPPRTGEIGPPQPPVPPQNRTVREER